MQFFKNHDLEKLFNKIKGSQYPQKVKGLQYPPKQSNKIIRWGVGGGYIDILTLSQVAVSLHWNYRYSEKFYVFRC